MAYTPELNASAVCALRRYAWSENKPMTKALEAAMMASLKRVDAPKVCAACRDRTKCGMCFFSKAKNGRR